APCGRRATLPGAGKNPRAAPSRRAAPARDPEPGGTSSLRGGGADAEVLPDAPRRRPASARCLGAVAGRIRPGDLLRRPPGRAGRRLLRPEGEADGSRELVDARAAA